MKKLILSILLFTNFIFCLPTVNTNTALSIDNIKQEVSDGTILVREWKGIIKEIKKDGFSLTILLTIIGIGLLSIVFIAVVLVMLINLVKFFTPDKIDKKLDIISDKIEEFGIKLPIKILIYVRRIVKKK